MDGARLVAEARAAREAGRSEEALDLYIQAAAAALAAGDPLARAHRLRHVGDIHREAGRDDEALSLYSEALAIYRRCPDRSALDLANLLRPLAMLREKAGERQAAAALWAEARALYEEAGVEAGVRESAGRLAALA